MLRGLAPAGAACALCWAGVGGVVCAGCTGCGAAGGTLAGGGGVTFGGGAGWTAFEGCAAFKGCAACRRGAGGGSGICGAIAAGVTRTTALGFLAALGR